MRESPFAPENFGEIAAYLRTGGVAVLPTDTIPGFAADAGNAEALQEIARLKKRPQQKPFLLLLPDFVAVERLCRIPAGAVGLIRRFWPGPLTLVLPRKKGALPGFFTHEPELAVRIPGNDLIRRFLFTFGRPLVSTSVNFAGEAPLQDFEAISSRFAGQNLLMAGSPGAFSSAPSTLVGFPHGRMVVYREGSISEHEIRQRQ
jgi:L-threonylcarbamoyladenylate synthase